MIRRLGFTLIELSMVVLIIGLVASAILLGRDMIEAAYMRQQIAQLTNYNTAVKTFREKYHFLPGDLPASEADALDMEPRSGMTGEGNGDGLIQAFGGADPTKFFGGEPALFWNDLAVAGLISGNYPDNTNALIEFPLSQTEHYLPRAKLGNNAFITVADGFYALIGNLYSLSFTGYMAQGVNVPWLLGAPLAPGVTPVQAFILDTKMDDGMPRSGHVLSGTMPISNPIQFFIEPWPFDSFRCFLGNDSTAVYDTADSKYSGHPICIMNFDFQ